MINLVTLQENLENLSQNFKKEDFIFDLLSAYEIPKSTLKILRQNPHKLSGNDLEVILKNKVLFHVTTLEEDEHLTIDTLVKDNNSYKFNPRFIIVTDFVTFLAVDTKTKETLDIKIQDLGKHYVFFLPWCGMEKAQYATENPADVRAADKMDKLYQSIVKDDTEYYKENSHDLNIFLSRLLFCFFAEDTGIFSKIGLFTNSISSHTHEDGSALNTYFSTLFEVLNTKYENRQGLASHFLEFPYVNGGLFEAKIKLPNFSSASRQLIIECGKLNWDSINPDIFGSMIQAVVHPGQRENLGMHYTSVPNIMKVIEPLFLNDLYEEFQKSKSDIKKLSKLRERIANIKIFDPACGSGNFLIISYKELCKLEIEIIRLLNVQDTLASQEGWNNTMSGITLNNFYGIEIDDFAHEIAKLSLYLAQHQINLKFEEEFGKLKPTLPLRESGKIEKGNSTRIDWDSVCPRKDHRGDEYEIYVVGNPPYLGSRNQEQDQKDDLEELFKNDYKILDYICAWFYKGSKYISSHQNIKLAFVSTNSIVQGEQVSVFWPKVFREGVDICFAYQSFVWKNLAKGNAGVTCVIIGLSNQSSEPKKLYIGNQNMSVKKINPYLAEGENLFITSRTKPLSNFPQMTYGNYTGGCVELFLDPQERKVLVAKYPFLEKFIRKFIGSQEFIKGIERYCLWFKNDDLSEVEFVPEIQEKFKKIKQTRLSSKDESLNKLASRPHQFRDLNETKKASIVIPIVSSERREYIPCGFVDSNTIIPNSAQAIYDPEVWIFGIISSRIHVAWVKSVAGRLRNDIRYSSALCYNTFPFPEITPKQKESLTTHVYNILEEREKYPEKTMSDLYDPDKMPGGLREAHKYLDIAIDQIYRSRPFENDEERLAHLFKLYEEMITKEDNK